MGNGISSKRIFFYLLVIFCSFSFVSQPAWADNNIDRVKLKKEKLPAGWLLTGEYAVPEPQIEQFERKFIAPVDHMVNQVIRVNGKDDVTVNYVDCPSEKDASFVYSRMVEMVGLKNAVVRDGNTVIEIISEDDSLKDKTMGMLRLSNLQSRKLKSSDVPEDWSLAREFFIYGDELNGFEKKLGVKLNEMINQYFLAGDHRVRINYIACVGEKDAVTAYERIREMVGKVNLVIRKDNLVIEIITDDEKTRRRAAEMLGRI